MLIILTGGVIGYQQYNKERKSVAEIEPDFVVSPEDIVTAFSDDEENANKKYLGKIIEVSGEVSDVLGDEGSYSLLLNGGDFGMVQCAFMTKPVSEYQIGDMVRIRGKCSGFLLDVILNECVILYNQ